MKKHFFILFTMVFAPLLSSAGNGIERFIGVDFTLSSDISERAKEKLTSFLNLNCQVSSLQSESITVSLVNLNRIMVDQGIIDETYTVKIALQEAVREKGDVVGDLVEITLTDYAGANPSIDWVQIESVKNYVQDFCMQSQAK